MRPTTDHPYIGKRFKVIAYEPPAVGTCVSVTKWGNDRVRWIKLRFRDGSTKSFAPSHLQRQPDEPKLGQLIGEHV